MVAPAMEIAAIDSGWYADSGYHNPSVTNYLVGRCGLPNCNPPLVFRNFFVFDLAAVSGPIMAASLIVENPTVAGYNSSDPLETWTVFDVSTSIPTLRSGGSGLTGIYDDLGSGTTYGDAVVNSSSSLVQIDLNCAALSALNAAAGGQFAFGGAITTLSGSDASEWVFGASDGPALVRKLVLYTAWPGNELLSANVRDGRPGSYFAFCGAGFPPNSTARVIVNDVELTDTLPVNATGGLTFRLDTSQSDAGDYFATVSVNPRATASFMLDPAAPLRPLDGSGPIVGVPGGIAFASIYVPLVQR
jgi:hypothetical protein